MFVRLAEEEKGRVLKAMRYLENATGGDCIKFREHSTQLTWIRIRKDKQGCFSSVGRRPLYLGPQDVNYQSPGCLKQDGTIQHELLHTLGLYHEQSRNDRDNNVTIFFENIIPRKFTLVILYLHENLYLACDYTLKL
jgi:hypothetical protein